MEVVMLLMTDLQNTKICALSKTKDINFKVFSMITRINEIKSIGRTHFMRL